MNVIVSNLYGNKFTNLDIDVIKSITGEFTVDEIVQSFSNFFFNRMFLDVTAIKDYNDVNNLKALSIGLDVSKIIFLLNDSISNYDYYVSKLIGFGIYNFAKTEDELKYLYDNPNSYRDVAHLQKNDIMSTIVAANNSTTTNNNSSNNNSFKEESVVVTGPLVIGVKNFTNHAGATSLVYMLKKELAKNYYVVAIEINKRDFMFFNDKDMVSCRSVEFNNMLLKYKDANVILVDLNDLDVTLSNLCSDIIYLMESSTLMINKVVMLDNKCFSKISDKKVILNRSVLNDKDVKQLEFETGLKFFGVLPTLNDRVDNSKYLSPIFAKLGLYKEVD